MPLMACSTAPPRPCQKVDCRSFSVTRAGSSARSPINIGRKSCTAAAVPVANYVEYLTPSPYIAEIITEPFKTDAEGYLPIPERPGLGIELNREALKKYGI